MTNEQIKLVQDSFRQVSPITGRKTRHLWG